MSLRETQELFWRAITWPTGVEAFLAQADAATRERFEATFAETQSFRRGERVGIYAEAYFWRQMDVLREGFPVLAFGLGEAAFRNLVTDYLLRCPSNDPSLRHLGDRLPGYLAGHSSQRDKPWLVEAARLDQWRYRLLDLPDQEPLAAHALAAIPFGRWPGLRFRMAGTAKLLRGHYDTHAMWMQSSERHDAPSRPPGGPDGEYHQLVWRSGFAVVHRPLELAEGRALRTLAAGGTFHEITAHVDVDGRGRGDPQQVVGWLSGWLAAGLIAEVLTAERDTP